MERLNPKERDVLDFIKAYILLNRYPPTFREIGKGARIASTAYVYDCMNELKRRNFIEYTSGSPRTIKIIKSRKELNQ